jgi:uncharacterized protein YjgD (DUF1641 family)
MANPRESYPETATNGATADASDGEAAVREAIDAHGEALANAIEHGDDMEALLTTAILVVASADDEAVERITSSTANLVAAVDGLSTDEAAALAADVGDDADALSDALETVVDLQRAGHLDDLVDIAKTVSALDVDEDAAAGMNAVLGSLGDAHRESEPVGVLGLLRGLGSRDARAGLGYLLALLKAQGRRLREE